MPGPPDEEDGAVGLWEEDQRDHGEARVDEADPEGPPPADGRGAEAGYDGGEERAENCGLIVVVAVVSEGREGSDAVVGSLKKLELTAKKDAMARPRVRYSP